MSLPTIIDGVLHAPYFIFIRCAGKYSDEELFRQLGISGYSRDASPAFKSYPYMTEDTNWVHIADDWYYTLWHTKTIRPALADIGKRHDVYACSVGDSDHSYDFVYYRDGCLVRRYVVEDPHYRGGSVVEDFGIPLPGEKEAMKHTDELRIVLAIAASLGIHVHHEAGSIRVYSKDRVGLRIPRL